MNQSDNNLVYRIDDNYLALLVDIEQSDHITLDVETTGLNPYHGDKICGLAIRFPYTSGKSYYVPVRHVPHKIVGMTDKGRPILEVDIDELETCNLPMDAYKKIIETIKTNATQRGFNYKFDLAFLRKDGMDLPLSIEDPMIMGYLCNENEKDFKLENLSRKYLGKESVKFQEKLRDILEEHGLQKGEMYKLHPKLVAPYAIEDVVLTDKLYDFYLRHIDVWKLHQVMEEYFDYELIVHMMEYNGMRVDRKLVKRYKTEAFFNARHIEHKIREQVGYQINLNSPKQTSAWLGTESSKLSVLEQIVETSDDKTKVENVRMLIEHKSWMKVYGTYYSRFEELMDENDVIHPSFQVIGTVSGRLSCRTPNLQAMPRPSKSKGGLDLSHIYKVKDVFVARPNNVYVSSDMSQIELRLGAVRANVKELKDKLMRGVDVHAETATQMGVERNTAKRINFSIFYGIGAPGLSEDMGVPINKAKEILRKYHELHPEIRTYARELEARARAHGYVRMFTGRVKRFPDKDQAHKAISSDIQGGVAELMRMALIKLHKLGLSQYLSNQIHDDIILEIPESMVDQVCPIVTRVLTEFDIMGEMPMATDTKIGKSWGGMTPYEQKDNITSD